jgi:hypothetical protein
MEKKSACNLPGMPPYEAVIHFGCIDHGTL